MAASASQTGLLPSRLAPAETNELARDSDPLPAAAQPALAAASEPDATARLQLLRDELASEVADKVVAAIALPGAASLSASEPPVLDQIAVNQWMCERFKTWPKDKPPPRPHQGHHSRKGRLHRLQGHRPCKDGARCPQDRSRTLDAPGSAWAQEGREGRSDGQQSTAGEDRTD